MESGKPAARSRRASFAGKSLTNFDSMMNHQHDSSSDQNNNNDFAGFSRINEQQEKKPAPPAELSDEEVAARAAFEAIYEMKHPGGTTPTNIDSDELHEFLSSFGLMSREALRDGDLKTMTASNNNNNNDLGAVSMRGGIRSPTAAAAPPPSVAKGDFVDFLVKQDQAQKQRDREKNKRRGSSAWIDLTVERHTAAIAKAQHLQQQQQQQQLQRQDSFGNQDSSSYQNDEMNNSNQLHNNNNLVSVVDLASDDGSQREGEGGSGNAGDGHIHTAQDSENTLLAIQKKLKNALEARANAPVPALLKLDSEIYNESLQNNNNTSGSMSPSNRRRSASPDHNSPAGRRAKGGQMNSMYLPANHSGKPNVSRPRSRNANNSSSSSHHHNNNTSSTSAGSPSAVLRKHQQSQLQALLEIRRNGGSMLAARAATPTTRTTAGGGAGSGGAGRKTPSTMAGFTVVKRK